MSPVHYYKGGNHCLGSLSAKASDHYCLETLGLKLRWLGTPCHLLVSSLLPSPTPPAPFSMKKTGTSLLRISHTPHKNQKESVLQVTVRSHHKSISSQGKDYFWSYLKLEGFQRPLDLFASCVFQFTWPCDPVRHSSFQPAEDPPWIASCHSFLLPYAPKG